MCMYNLSYIVVSEPLSSSCCSVYTEFIIHAHLYFNYIYDDILFGLKFVRYIRSWLYGLWFHMYIYTDDYIYMYVQTYICLQEWILREEWVNEPCLPFLFCDSFQQFLSHKWASYRPVHRCLKQIFNINDSNL